MAARAAVLVFSEFGRRVAENATHGTDHGTAAPVFIIGGAIRRGLVGTTPSLIDLEDGDLKAHIDFLIKTMHGTGVLMTSARLCAILWVNR